MNSGQSDISSSQLGRSFRHRCWRLGLATWVCRSDGTIIDEPGDESDAGRWFRSPWIRNSVHSAVRSWRTETRPTVINAFNHCWQIPLLKRQGASRRLSIVAVALGPEATSEPEFQAACESANLNVETTAAALESVNRHHADGIDHLVTLLQWMNDDLDRSERDVLAVEDLSRRLNDTYEELSLVYRLGRMHTLLSDPVQFVRTVCQEMSRVVRFDWVAARFRTGSPALTGIEGKLITVGYLPCGRDHFAEIVGEVCDRVRLDQWSLVETEIGTATGSDRQNILAVPVRRDGEMVGVMLAGSDDRSKSDITSVETQLFDAAANYVANFLQSASLYAEQHSLFMGTLRSLTSAIDAKDPYTRGHSERVALMSSKLAMALELDPKQVEQIRIAGMVHDVGKIGVPEAVLRKEGELSEEEFNLIKQHPTIGYEILKDIPLLGPMLPGVLHHHERWDGGGYPSGRCESDIPLVARIIGLADTFDAMSSSRSYRPAMSRAKVFEEIELCGGSQFDPELVPVFLGLDFTEYDVLVARQQRNVTRQAA